MGAEHRPNMRNPSSMFRYGGVGAYLVYTYLMVRQFLIALCVSGEGEIAPYVSGSDGIRGFVLVMVSMRVSMRIGVRMRVRLRVAYASVFGIPRADVAADSLIGRFFRSPCKIVYCICFPAYVG